MLTLLIWNPDSIINSLRIQTFSTENASKEHFCNTYLTQVLLYCIPKQLEPPCCQAQQIYCKTIIKRCGNKSKDDVTSFIIRFETKICNGKVNKLPWWHHGNTYFTQVLVSCISNQNWTTMLHRTITFPDHKHIL